MKSGHSNAEQGKWAKSDPREGGQEERLSRYPMAVDPLVRYAIPDLGPVSSDLTDKIAVHFWWR